MLKHLFCCFFARRFLRTYLLPLTDDLLVLYNLFKVNSFIYPLLINVFTLYQIAEYTFIAASDLYSFPRMHPEVTPDRCTFNIGAKAA